MTSNASAPKPPPLPLKTKFFLALGSTVFALVVSAVVLQFVPTAPKGTEFDTIDDVRRAMMRDDPEQNESVGPDAGGELGGGSISLRAIVRPHADDRIIYTLKPGLDLQFIRARVRTNSCGMRSPERPVTKEPGVYRIAVLGDSFTFGWGVEQNESFAQVLEDTLNRVIQRSNHPKVKRVEVLNFGVPGYSTFQEVALFRELGTDFQPDAVLVYFVQNDFGMPFFIRDISGQGGILSSLKFVQLGKRLFAPDEMQHQIEAMGLDPNHAIGELDDLTKELGIPTYLTINPRKSWKADLSRLWRMKSSGIQFIPLRDSLLEYVSRHQIKEEDLTLSFDPHPSPIRHNILGNILAPYFLEKIAHEG